MPTELTLDGLGYEPPPAAVRGTQTVWWCAHCGTVLIATIRTKPAGPCPCCDKTMWQRATFPIYGLTPEGDGQ